MRRYSVDTLVIKVMSTWRDLYLGPVIVKVIDCLENMFILINEGEEGNDLVKTKRGKQHEDIKFDFTLNVSNIQKANRN